MGREKNNNQKDKSFVDGSKTCNKKENVRQ